jgi:hypothetical protein
MKFKLMRCDIYHVEAEEIDQANDKLTDFIDGKDVSGVELVDEQLTIEYPEEYLIQKSQGL